MLSLAMHHALDRHYPMHLLTPRAFGIAPAVAMPKLQETHDGHEVVVEAPGIPAEDFEVIIEASAFEPGILTLAATRNGVRSQSAVRIPEDADVKSAKATLEYGILRIHFKRDEMAPPTHLTLCDPDQLGGDDPSKFYRLTLKAPGVAPDDLSVTVHPDPRVREIEIAGETTVAGRKYTIDKRVHLPRDADAEDAAVSLANGILTLVVPKPYDADKDAPAEKIKLTIEEPAQAKFAKAAAADLEQQPEPMVA